MRPLVGRIVAPAMGCAIACAAAEGTLRLRKPQLTFSRLSAPPRRGASGDERPGPRSWETAAAIAESMCPD
jgi:hypothetical protein